MRRRRLLCTMFSFVLACSTSIPVGTAAEEAKSESVQVKDLTLVIPKAWKTQPPANKLRLAQFLVPRADGDTETTELVISSFGGGGGGVQANITRWISQFEAGGREQQVTQGTAAQGKYVVVDLKGTYRKPDGPPFLRQTIAAPNHRMLGAIVIIEGKGTYFLKMVGPQKTVEQAAADFRKSFGADAEKENAFKP